MNLEKKMKDLIERQGLSYREKRDTIHTMCPGCQRDDKLSILKKNGATICYRGKCSFGQQWFGNWLALTAGIPLKQALQMLKEEQIHDELGSVELDLLKESDPLEPVSWPPQGTISVTPDLETEGSLYLENRGIAPALAERYGIRYNTVERRVVFPIFMDGTCYGYQGRAIDDVPKEWRMRSNPGIRRNLLVMFWDMVPQGGDIAIIEGPIDGIKFDQSGAFPMPTMGKVVSDDQIKLIMKKKPKRIFIGLDDDALGESEKLKNKIFGVELYTITVPCSCRVRCEAIDKKPDFGECTLPECAEAIQAAERVDRSKITLTLR